MKVCNSGQAKPKKYYCTVINTTGTVVNPPDTGNPPVTDAPVVNPPLPPVEPCTGDNCTEGIPTPPDNRCNNPQNRAPQPAPQTTLNPKAGATDFERLLHMSILFYEAQAGFRKDFVSGFCTFLKCIKSGRSK